MLSDLEMRPNQIAAHTMELESAMNKVLSEKWGRLRGLEVVSVALNPITLPEEDQELIKQFQKGAAMRDPNMAGAQIAGATADAMRAAAANEGGAMNGFVGMGMAMNAGGSQAANLFAMGQQQQQNQPPQQTAGAWKCECGAENNGKFCTECGKPRPQSDKWFCSECGTENHGKFCTNCGKPR